MKKQRILTALLLIITAFFSSCSPASAPDSPSVTPYRTPLPTLPATPEDTQESPETSIAPTPTPTPTPEDTADPAYKAAFGPFVFGQESYKIGIEEERIVVYKTDAKVFYTFEGEKISDEEKALFLLSVSFMDLNFDVIPDFSYKKTDGTRVCYLGSKNADGSMSFKHNAELSAIRDLSRCYETRELYGRPQKESDIYYTIKISEEGIITETTPLENGVEWDISSITAAIAGNGVSATESTDTQIRSVTCKTYTLGGFITIALDDYGNYYIKDMPHQGFCRLVLNPNGRWSKSEKVTQDSPLQSIQ